MSTDEVFRGEATSGDKTATFFLTPPLTSLPTERLTLIVSSSFL